METSVEELMADRLKDAFTFDSEYQIVGFFATNSIALWRCKNTTITDANLW
jgi:hypothetical protein